MGFCCSSRFEQSTSFLFQEQHSKATNMPVEKTREEFIVWIRLAMNDRESGAYEQLYQFLWNCFCRADVGNKGKVTLDQFDTLIEEAAELPRLYGFAPSSAAMSSSGSGMPFSTLPPSTSNCPRTICRDLPPV